MLIYQYLRLGWISIAYVHNAFCAFSAFQHFSCDRQFRHLAMTHAYLCVEACNQSWYKLVHPKLAAYVLGGRVGVSGTQ